MATTAGFSTSPATEQGGQRYSHDSTSTLQAPHENNTATRDQLGKPPFRYPVYVGCILVALVSLGIFILNGISGNDAKAADHLASLPIAIVSFIWALTNLLGGIFMPSLFHPSRFWMVKVLVSMIVTAGSWVSFGGLIERISGSVHRGLFLCLLIPLASLVTLTTICMMIQKYKTSRGPSPDRFVQSPSKQ